MSTLAGQTVTAFIGVTANRTSFTIGFFDGDQGGHWDIGSGYVLLYRLYADPLKDGTGTTLVVQWDSSMLSNDAWKDFSLPVHGSARAPSGNYFYRLDVNWVDPASTNLNAFKIRCDTQVSIGMQRLGFGGGPNNLGVDPPVGSGDPRPGTDLNDAGANSYDGRWSFFSWVDASSLSLTFRDGDADHGQDTDDSDTPNVDPDGSGPAQAEGAHPGAPADDGGSNSGSNVPGSVRYDVISPDGRIWSNLNPSGNIEWEDFVIDGSGSSLPSGFYEVRWANMDAHNFVFLLPPGEIYSAPDPPLPVQNRPPVADAGPDLTANQKSTITLDGSRSYDLDGTIVSYAWELGDGSTWQGALVTHAYGDVGTWVAALTVTDDKGASDRDTATITLTNLPPVARAGPDIAANQMDDITFDGSVSSDTDGVVVSYRWEFGDGATAFGAVSGHNYGQTGVYTVTLTVTDDDGASGTDTAVVSLGNLPPVANAGLDFSVGQGSAAQLDGSGSRDQDGTIVSYAWELGDGSTGTGASVSHVYADDGAYTATLTVTDDDGASAADTVAVTVANAPPVADAGPDETGNQLITFDFDGSRSSDSDGVVVLFDWDFGDGTGVEGAVVTHAYGDDGTYTVTLTVRDDDGASATDTLTVIATNMPPVADAGADQGLGKNQETVFNANASHDPDGSIVAYYWEFGDGTNGTGVAVRHSFTVAGTYTVTLTVTDDDGATGSDVAMVFVANQPPVAEAGPDRSGVAGETVSFNGSGSIDFDGRIVSYEWDLGDGSTGSGILVSHMYQIPGTYTVTLTVTDNDGARASDTALAVFVAPPSGKLELSKVKLSGPDSVPMFTRASWEMRIDVWNSGAVALADVAVTDTVPGEYGIVAMSYNAGSVSTRTTGKATHIDWSVGELGPGASASLWFTVATKLNPAGKQEFTSPGTYVLNPGASATAIDAATGSEVSDGPTPAIWVVATEFAPGRPTSGNMGRLAMPDGEGEAATAPASPEGDMFVPALLVAMAITLGLLAVAGKLGLLPTASAGLPMALPTTSAATTSSSALARREAALRAARYRLSHARNGMTNRPASSGPGTATSPSRKSAAARQAAQRVRAAP
jgi:PKD repeat protein